MAESDNANPVSDFRFDAALGDGGGYIHNLNPRGLSRGTWTRQLTASGDPVIHSIQFDLRQAFRVELGALHMPGGVPPRRTAEWRGEEFMSQYDASHTKRGPTWQLLLELFPAAGAANDDQPLEQVTNALCTLGLQPVEADRIRQAFARFLWQATKGRQGEDRSRVCVRIWVLGLPAAADPYGSGPEDQSVRRRNRGGWGFFLLERREDEPGTTEGKAHRIIELYLYQES